MFTFYPCGRVLNPAWEENVKEVERSLSIVGF